MRFSSPSRAHGHLRMQSQRATTHLGERFKADDAALGVVLEERRREGAAELLAADADRVDRLGRDLEGAERQRMVRGVLAHDHVEPAAQS